MTHKAVTRNIDECLHLHNILFSAQPPGETSGTFMLITAFVQVDVIIYRRYLFWNVYIRGRRGQLIERLCKLLHASRAGTRSMRKGQPDVLLNLSPFYSCAIFPGSYA